MKMSHGTSWASLPNVQSYTKLVIHINEFKRDTYWLKCCSALGSKTINEIVEPGPIFSDKRFLNEKKKRISNVQTDFQDFDQLKRKDQQKLIKLFDYERTIERNLSENSTTVNTTYLEHQQDGKFWQISIENKSTKTKYGLLNEPHSNSIFLLKEFSNQNQAQKYFDTKIKEKLKRGYSIQKQITPKRKRLTTRSTTNKKKN